MKIKILRDVAASSKHYSEGDILEAPEQISQADAETLIRLRAAALVPPKGMTEELQAEAPAEVKESVEEKDSKSGGPKKSTSKKK